MFDTTLQSKGKIEFIDKENDIFAEIDIGNVKKKPSDYFKGFIKVKKDIVSEIYGTYMGFIEFDKVLFYITKFLMIIIFKIRY